jgi:hypothetical protein
MFEQLEDRTLLNNGTFASPFLINPTASQPESLATANQGVYAQLTLPSNGTLTAQVQPSAGLTTRLSLLNPDGSVLVQSDGQVGNPNDLITQSLPGGTYLLEVQGLNGGTGNATLTTTFLAGNLPFSPIQAAPFNTSSALVSGDFAGNGRQDLATLVNPGFGVNGSVAVLLANGAGTFQTPQNFAVGQGPIALVTGDFNGDHKLDLAVANASSNTVSILLGNGDGTFQPAVSYAVGGSPSGLMVADLGNGHLDLVALTSNNNVSILLGDGTGNFASAVPYPMPIQPVSVIAADFGNGHLDLAVNGSIGFTPAVSVFLGNGDGTFQPATTYTYQPNSLGLAPGSVSYPTIVVADFGNGHVDLATSNPQGVAVLLGNGDGTFQPAVSYVLHGPGVAFRPLVAADFGNGHIDLATPDGSDVGVLLGNGDGTFQPEHSYATSGIQGAAMSTPLLMADLGNGHFDLVCESSTGLSVFLGNGDGTFQPEALYTNGSFGAGTLLAADLFGTGHLDLATAGAGTIAVVYGNGDGTFQHTSLYQVAGAPGALLAADFGNGHVDLASAASGNNRSISVLLGNGDGSFGTATAYPDSHGPVSLLAGDFNGDGNLDLVAVNADGTVSLLLGLGDGTFQQPKTFQAASQTATPGTMIFIGGIIAADFGNGHMDLAVAYTISPSFIGFPPPVPVGEVDVVLGNGDGTFQAPVTYAAGTAATGLVAKDFGNGHLDLATGSGSALLVFLGNGNGTFQAAVSYAVGSNVGNSLVAADFGNGYVDLAAATFNGIVVLLGNGNGTFQPAVTYPAPTGHFQGLMAADFGNHHLDLVTVAVAFAGGFPITTSESVAVLLGNGDGTFQAPVTSQVYNGTTMGTLGALVAEDFGNGQLDLAVTTPNGVAVLLGNGNGTFQAPVDYSVFPGPVVATDFGNGTGDLAVGSSVINVPAVSIFLGSSTGALVPGAIVSPLQATPLTADINGDGTLDTVIVNQAGSILFRAGLPQAPGTFAPPIVVNPGHPAREADIVTTSTGDLIASLDSTTKTVSLYRYNAGSFSLVGTLPVGALASRILAAHLTSNAAGPADDLVVLNAGDGTVTIFLSNGSGGFLAPTTISVGLGGSDLAVALDPTSGAPDILIPNQLTGDTTVLVNNGFGVFTTQNSFRAGFGPYSAGTLTGQIDPTVQSDQRSAGLVTGDFTGHGLVDAIVINPGADTYALLTGQNGGSYLNPIVSTPLGFSPTAIAAGKFALNINSFLDFALLNPIAGTVEVFLNNGLGAFHLAGTYQVGANATSLSAADVNKDGIPDLLIGNSYGDILVLLGNGDGTFRYLDSAKQVALAVEKLNPANPNEDDFVYSDQSLNQVAIQYGGNTPAAFQGLNNGILNPGAVTLADLNGDGIPDMVVADSGRNLLLVYLGLGNGQFGPALRYAVGDDPVGVTIADLNGDGILDLVVANKGSNDVSILLGQGQKQVNGVIANWTLVNGPRLSSGGIGPVSTVVADVTGPGGKPDGVPDILASNSGSNNVGLLPGVGQGFFNANGFVPAGTAPGPSAPPPMLIPVGASPSQLVQIQESSGTGFVVLNSGDRTFTELTNFTGAQFTTATIDTGGFNPTAVIARDFNGDGLTDLVIANNDTSDLPEPDLGGQSTGDVTFLLGTDTGFNLDATFTDPAMPNPSAVALSALNPDNEFYATTDGVEHAFAFHLNLGEPLAQATPPPTTESQLVPGAESPGSFAPVLSPGSSLQGLPDLVTRTGPELTEGPDLLLGRDAVVNPGGTPNGFSLFIVADGSKGDSADAWQRVLDALEEARETWVSGLREQAAGAWEAFTATVQEIGHSTEVVANQLGAVLALDHLELPDLHWRELGTSLFQIGYGSVRTTFTAATLAEMGDRLYASFEEVVAPYLPTPVPVSPTLEVPALEGARRTLESAGSIVQSALPPLSSTGASWSETLNRVSRSLFEATGFAPVRSHPVPAQAVPVFLAEERLRSWQHVDGVLNAELALPPTHFDDFRASRSWAERDALWLVLALAAIKPLRGDVTPEEDERHGVRKGGSLT